jgi:glycosyltransferase 2 family protein
MASRHLRLAGGILLALALLAFFFKDMEWAALLAALRTADPLLLAGVVASSLATYVLRAWRWGYLLNPVARVPFADLFSATTVGFMTGLIVPRAGEIVRPYLVSRRHPVATSAGFATIILERLFDLLTVLLLFGLYLFVLPTPDRQSRGAVMDVVRAAGATTAIGALVVLGLLFVFHARAEPLLAFCDRVLRIFPAWLAAPAGRMLRAFAAGLAVLRAPLPHLVAIVAQSFLVWLSIAVAIHLNNRAFGVDLPFHATFLIIAFLTVGVAIPTPGMVGGFHGFFIWALADVYGVGRDVSGAAAIACHVLNNLPVLVLGLAFLGREGLSLGRVAAMTEDKGAGPLPATEASKP